MLMKLYAEGKNLAGVIAWRRHAVAPLNETEPYWCAALHPFHADHDDVGDVDEGDHHQYHNGYNSA